MQALTDSIVWLSLSKVTTLQQQTVVKETWLDYEPERLHSSDRKEAKKNFKTFEKSSYEFKSSPNGRKKIFKEACIRDQAVTKRDTKKKKPVTVMKITLPLPLRAAPRRDRVQPGSQKSVVKVQR